MLIRLIRIIISLIYNITIISVYLYYLMKNNNYFILVMKFESSALNLSNSVPIELNLIIQIKRLHNKHNANISYAFDIMT